MSGEIIIFGMIVLSLLAFVDIQRYIADPQRKQKSEAWFAKFHEYNKETSRDPKLKWRREIIENLFDGIHT